MDHKVRRLMSPLDGNGTAHGNRWVAAGDIDKGIDLGDVHERNGSRGVLTAGHGVRRKLNR